jgi:hypothetical protein
MKLEIFKIELVFFRLSLQIPSPLQRMEQCVVFYFSGLRRCERNRVPPSAISARLFLCAAKWRVRGVIFNEAESVLKNEHLFERA